MRFENDSILIEKLEWDTTFFKVKSAKIILKKEISIEELYSIKKKISEFNSKFITINNLYNNDKNNFILKDIENLFLADINVQFEKKIEEVGSIDEEIVIKNNLEEKKDIVNIANKTFIYSRFINDPNLPKNKKYVYSEWAKNSFNNKHKYFCYYQKDNKIQGFLLFSINDNEKIATIELIGVDKENKNNGIGKKLLSSTEQFLYKNDIKVINVGTQINNIIAQNFYMKCGFKHISNNSIYHWWN